MLEDLLKSKQCFKLVCGAGNEDVEEIQKLIEIYYNAGCRFFDLSMNEDVVKMARETAPKAYISISTGIKGDPHLNKVKINAQKCNQCKLCKRICPQEAIDDNLNIQESTCIGCLKCTKVCSQKAIEIYSKNKPLEEILPPLLKYKPDCIELHAIGEDENDVDEKWNYISQNYNGLLSICIDRSKLSNEK